MIQPHALLRVIIGNRRNRNCGQQLYNFFCGLCHVSWHRVTSKKECTKRVPKRLQVSHTQDPQPVRHMTPRIHCEECLLSAPSVSRSKLHGFQFPWLKCSFCPFDIPSLKRWSQTLASAAQPPSASGMHPNLGRREGVDLCKSLRYRHCWWTRRCTKSRLYF